MTETTPLDSALTRMNAAPEDETARLRFYERLADSELFLALDGDPGAAQITPRVFPVEGDRFVLVFDREDRLADFAEGPAPYAVLSGRGLAAMLAGQGIGLAVNPGGAASILIAADAVDWLADTLSAPPVEVEETPKEIRPPKGLPESLVAALDTKLATAAGLAKCAFLCGVSYAGGRRSHLLAFVDPVPGAEAALARAAGEALTFSGIEAGVMDVGFFRASDPLCASLAKAGLRFDLPEPHGPRTAPGGAPGMDPDTPPRLR